MSDISMTKNTILTGITTYFSLARLLLIHLRRTKRDFSLEKHQIKPSLI